MIVSKKQAREIANLILELCDSPGEYVDLKKSFKGNLNKIPNEIPNKFKFKASGKEQEDFLKEYLKTYHIQNFIGGWKSYAQDFYLCIENGEYITGSLRDDLTLDYELINYDLFREYVSRKVKKDNYQF